MNSIVSLMTADLRAYMALWKTALALHILTTATDYDIDFESSGPSLFSKICNSSIHVHHALTTPHPFFVHAEEALSC